VVGTGTGDLPLLAATETTAVIAGVIHAWKYHGQRGLVGPLAAALAKSVRLLHPWEGCDLVPVPLHPRRLRARGFNQSALLARVLALHLGAGVREDLVARVRATAQQARLSDPEARMGNVVRAFRSPGCTARPVDRPLVVVDDVVTSGATVVEVVRALSAADLPVVAVLAIATSLPGQGARAAKVAAASPEGDHVANKAARAQWR